MTEQQCRPPWSKKCERCGGSGSAVVEGKVSVYGLQCSSCYGRGWLPASPPQLPAAVVELARVCYEGAGQRVCGRCDGGGRRIGADRPFEYGNDAFTALVCPDCSGTGFLPPTQPTYALRDALLECGQVEMAEHFAGDEWHPKGCWAIDAILGKS